MLTSPKTHILIGKIPIKKKHVKFFLLYSGMVLMTADATFAICGACMAEELHRHFEPFFANGGKVGGALSGMSCWCEKILAEDV